MDLPDTSSVMHETHISIVFGVGDRVYKLKKPIATGFLDWTSQRDRRAACHREVELNRRLSPDVYLGVADIVGDDGQVYDHLVVMRRMPEARRLSTLVSTNAPVEACLVAVAREVAAFHSTAERSPEIDRCGTQDHVRELWQGNLREMIPFTDGSIDGDTLAECERLALRYVEGRASLFAERLSAGRTVDGHGDLMADDIFCLDDGPRILDCIEFSDLFRRGDVLADVAFLAMDLERLGAPDLARRFLDAYREFGAETHPASAEHHWIAYRALVRCKVACLRAAQGMSEALDAARFHLEQCHAHLRRAEVRLVLVGGLPGTGKSTLAAGIADHQGWVLLRTDEVRKEITGLGHEVHAPAAFGEGIYDPAVTHATYREVLRRATVALERGESVVADASWTDREARAFAEEVAAGTSSRLIEFQCTAPHDVSVERIVTRRDDVSDATPAIAAEMATHRDPWPGAHLIETTASIDDVLAHALALLDAPA